MFGGFDGTTSLTSVEISDLFVGEWQQSGNLPVGLHQHCIANLPPNGIIIIGGIVDGKPSKKTYISSTLQNEWYEGPELNVPRSGASCGDINNGGQVIVAGGYNEDGYLHSSEVTRIRDANLPTFKVSLLIAQTRSSE